MSSQYKLTYFQIMGLAEPIRFLLTYGKLNFEDFRVEREAWPALKPSTPVGQIPVIQIGNGKMINQSRAICRYIGKTLKIVGKNDLEDLDIDAVVDTIDDLRAKLHLFHYDYVDEKKAEFSKTLFGEIAPLILKRLDEGVKVNNGYLAAGKLTWADIYFVGILGYLDGMAKRDLIESGDYPNLKKLKEKILAIPEINQYVSTRPKTET